MHQSVPSIGMPYELPAHVPPARVVDFDIYAPHGPGEDYFAAWLRFRERTPFPIVWTPRNGGHWVVTRGPAVLEVYSASDDFSVDSFGVPRAVGAQRHLGAESRCQLSASPSAKDDGYYEKLA